MTTIVPTIPCWWVSPDLTVIEVKVLPELDRNNRCQIWDHFGNHLKVRPGHCHFSREEAEAAAEKRRVEELERDLEWVRWRRVSHGFGKAQCVSTQTGNQAGDSTS